MPILVERITGWSRIAPWLWYQHVARYQWASQFAKGCKVIDAACGTGYGSKIVLDNGAERYDGFDLSVDAISEARRLYDIEGLRFERGDVTCLPVEGHSYDLYVSIETIEHVENDRAFLAEVVRVLKPGGKFICSTPNRALMNPGTSITDRPFNPYHVREYTSDELQDLLHQYFPSVALFGQTHFDRRYCHMLGGIGRRVPRLAVRLHQARKVLGAPWERPERHYPGPIQTIGHPEILIAMCSTGNS